MSIDTTQLLQMVAGLSEDIESDHPDAEIGTFAVVVEISDAEGNWTMIKYRCNDERRWVQAGFFAAAKEASEHSHERLGDDE